MTDGLKRGDTFIMSDFFQIFKKVNGWNQLKDYSKSHVLSFALAETALLGTSRKSLEIVRLAVQNKIYQRLKKQNKKLIANFVKQHPTQKKQKHRKVIWISWLQGIENAPEVVQCCYASVKEHLKDWEIIVITEENYSDYVDFPDYVIEKYKEGKITKVHFSDLLRIELLAKYGGTWLDATVFCSGPVTDELKYLLESDLFVYQNLKPGLDGHATAISSWMMTACANNNIVLLTRKLLYNYWKSHDRLVDYFIIHNFFQMALEAYPEEWKKVIPVSNSMPHVLLLRMFEKYDERVWNEVKRITPFHKLSYKFSEKDADLSDTYFNVVIRGGKQ